MIGNFMFSTNLSHPIPNITFKSKTQSNNWITNTGKENFITVILQETVFVYKNCYE